MPGSSSSSPSGPRCDRGASGGSVRARAVAPTHTSTLAQPAPTRPQTATIGAAAAVATRFRTRADVSPAAITRR